MKESLIQESVLPFNRRIIDATHDLVCAYKINPAFYQQEGIKGVKVLMETIDYIHLQAPQIPVILDGKYGDVAHTSIAYAKSAFFSYKADAVTVNPLLGRDSVQPFLNYEDKGIFIVCHTSNPGSREFQDAPLIGTPLYQKIAQHVMNTWNSNNNCGLIVGATFPDQLFHVRQIAKDMPILLPGIGAQKGNLKQSIRAGMNSQKAGMIICLSRSAIFASQENDFDQAARNETMRVRDEVNGYIGTIK